MSERIYWRYTPSPLRSPYTPNPNARHDRAALAHWLPLSDPYVYPHVQVPFSPPAFACGARALLTRVASLALARCWCAVL